ncbi:MAG: SRPBCC domain-containing protein [Saprospiraceae bacterium]|nr:SRPBCC domain-containing protein [Saprospiraceae bacterium]
MMTPSSDREIFSSRVLFAPVDQVYHLFANPVHLKNWWGLKDLPIPFMSLTCEWWQLDPHHARTRKGHYENASVFKTVVPLHSITWTRISKPHFDMEVGFEALDEMSTRITFRMLFTTPEECNKIRAFAGPKNEENFDRLERELVQLTTSSDKN